MGCPARPLYDEVSDVRLTMCLKPGFFLPILTAYYFAKSLFFNDSEGPLEGLFYCTYIIYAIFSANDSDEGTHMDVMRV